MHLNGHARDVNHARRLTWPLWCISQPNYHCPLQAIADSPSAHLVALQRPVCLSPGSAPWIELLVGAEAAPIKAKPPGTPGGSWEGPGFCMLYSTGVYWDLLKILPERPLDWKVLAGVSSWSLPELWRTYCRRWGVLDILVEAFEDVVEVVDLVGGWIEADLRTIFSDCDDKCPVQPSGGEWGRKQLRQASTWIKYKINHFSKMPPT